MIPENKCTIEQYILKTFINMNNAEQCKNKMQSIKVSHIMLHYLQMATLKYKMKLWMRHCTVHVIAVSVPFI